MIYITMATMTVKAARKSVKCILNSEEADESFAASGVGPGAAEFPTGASLEELVEPELTLVNSRAPDVIVAEDSDEIAVGFPVAVLESAGKELSDTNVAVE